MPRGPKGEKRRADVIGNAIKVARIATGEEDEALTDDGKDKAAVNLGKRGGEARAAHHGRAQALSRCGRDRFRRNGYRLCAACENLW